MAYINWFSIEEIYAGTTIKDKNNKANNSMALHTGDSSDDIIENRNKLAVELDIPLQNFVFANQTHSTNIVEVSIKDQGKGALSNDTSIPDCDGLYTKDKNVLIGVFSADCVPILLYDKGQGIICALHAGWKGTTKQIVKKMLHILKYEENSLFDEVYAYIGPAIDFLNYEVDQNVVDEIHKMECDTNPYIIPKENNKYLVDLKGLNHQLLLDAGIQDTHIFVHHGDTFENEQDFFSFRARKEKGRNMTFILRK